MTNGNIYGVTEGVDQGIMIGKDYNAHPSFTVLPADTPTLTADQVEAIMPVYQVVEPTFPFVEPWTGEEVQMPMPDHKVLVNGRTGKVLGTPTKKYEENQPSEWGPMMAQLAIDNGCSVVTAGSLSAGARSFMAIKLPEDYNIELGGNELCQQFLNLGDAVDSTSPFAIGNAAMRLICLNVWRATLTGQKAMIRISHTKSGPGRLQAFMQSFEASLLLSKDIAGAVDQLINTSYTEAQFMDMVRHESVLGAQPVLDDEGKGQRGITSWSNRFDEIVSHYNADDIAPIKDTAWGAIQAIQGWEQHTAAVKKVDRSVRHIERVMFDEQVKTLAASNIVRADIGMLVNA